MCKYPVRKTQGVRNQKPHGRRENTKIARSESVLAFQSPQPFKLDNFKGFHLQFFASVVNNKYISWTEIKVFNSFTGHHRNSPYFFAYSFFQSHVRI